MKLSPHKIYTGAQAVGAGLLLGPFAVASLQSERWSILVLSCLSIALILGNALTTRDRMMNSSWLAPLAGILVLLGIGFSIDKLLLLAGVLFLSSALFSKAPLPKGLALAVLACACLMVPLPADLEIELATRLATVEASLFVAIGQALDLPVRLSGAQIFFGQSVVTINQDCSGTLLLIPALLGSITAAALSKNKASAILILSLALPGALLINLLRIAVVLGLMASGDHELADKWHDILGFMALAFSWCLPLWLFVDLETVQIRLKPTATLAHGLALLMVGGIATITISRIDHQEATPKLELPAYVSGWVAEASVIPPEEIKILNADQVNRRRYTSENGEFLLTAIYHRDPKVGREHTSARCFRAMGWQVARHGSQPVGNAGTITSLTVSSGGHRQAVVELEIEDTKISGGLLRVQLVASPDLAKNQQQDLILLFANNILGEAT